MSPDKRPAHFTPPVVEWRMMEAIAGRAPRFAAISKETGHTLLTISTPIKHPLNWKELHSLCKQMRKS